MRRAICVLAVLVLSLNVVAAWGDGEPDDPPVAQVGAPCLDAAAIGQTVCTPVNGGAPGSCVRNNTFTGLPEDPYGDKCRRLRFAYGPILVQPGDNDTGPYVMSVDKPLYDGSMVRLRPNLVRADGSVPNVEDIHLHHATWLSVPSYGNGPWFASGEEKTIANFPVGYGMPVKRSDAWYAVFMIHNEGTQPEFLWATLEIDYVAAGDAADLGIKPIKPFWLDVWKNGHRSSYPVFNAQRGYGGPITDPVTLDIIRDPVSQLPFATKECTWPRDACAFHDSWGGTEVGQGAAGNGLGTDIYTTGGMAGTLIGIGGHVHPGGLRVEVDAVKCLEGSTYQPGGPISSWDGVRCADGPDADTVASEEARRIFISDAVYFDDAATPQGENTPTSWNLSMTVTGIPYWKVKLQQGQLLRINAVYETDMANWYEGMGIAVAYVAPPEPDAIDPFAGTTIRDDRPAAQCWTDPNKGPGTLCTRGVITHGPLPEAGNRGGGNISNWTPGQGIPTDTIAIDGFQYLPGNLGTAGRAIPEVEAGAPLTWVNLDAALNVFHTVTTCAYPCNGTTGIAYPIADHGWGVAPAGGGPIAVDSSELGFSPDFGPARGSLPPPEGADPVEWARNGATYSIVPADYGLAAGDVVTYFCRIHPFMRGAFRVAA